MNPSELERIDPNVLFAMTKTAREKTWQAISDIRALILPGMTEKEAITKANAYFASRGVRKFWHRTHVRFGESTILSFEDPYTDNVVLKDDDIFFLDIGPVWDGVEGDCGDTFVVGNNPAYLRIQSDVKVLFEDVRAYWRRNKPTGIQLYEYAGNQTEKMGYLLHPSYVKGHRLSEFSHSTYTKANVGELNFCPATERWVLEFQICDPSKKFGAFYEDLLD